MKLTARKIGAVLKSRGYRLTPQRNAILSAVTASHDHLTPTAIHEKVRREHKNIGLVTVYRTIELLAELGLICEVHSGGNCHSYLLRRPDQHHHHLICSGCGTVADFTSCDLSDMEQKVSRQTGFDINSHLLEFMGLCRSCQKDDRPEGSVSGAK
ncbi:MAG: transcriptional repressor [Chloroflexi bacterium]|nr:transcriptional repressor [Chloroflexota bacterium]MBT7080949.1 transcriptional repressor [Chloroflexota bacterium]MBT7290098.1 transcriptional repressor [Chloroflexota bacterium]